MDVNILQQFAQYGLLGLTLFFIGLGTFLAARSIGRWAVPQVNRVIDSHITFIEKVDVRMEKMETDIDGVKGILTNQTNILDRIERNTNNGKYS